MRELAAAFALASTLGASAQAAPALPAPPEEIGAITLPPGRLQPLSYSDRGAFFIDIERSGRKGDKAEAWIYTIYQPPIETDYGAAVELVSHGRLDCIKRTWSEAGAQAFDAAGKLVMWLPPEPKQAIEANSTYDFQARVLCDGETPPLPPVQDRAAAKAMALTTLNSAGR